AICLVHERRVGVALGIDGDGADAHRVRRAHDAPRDLAAIGDQQPADRRQCYIRHVPNSLVPDTTLLWQADSAMPRMGRVSRGSIMPSSETREVANRPLDRSSAQNSTRSTRLALASSSNFSPRRSAAARCTMVMTPAICFGPITAIFAVGQVKAKRVPKA